MDTETTTTTKKEKNLPTGQADLPVGKTGKSGEYIEAVGRRKTSVARVRITEGKKMDFIVNSKELATYFPTKELQDIINDPFNKGEIDAKFSVSVLVKGGGIHSQAEAVRHGITRALVRHNSELRKELKSFGFLKRDPREKERRKFGLKKARKAAQWSKR